MLIFKKEKHVRKLVQQHADTAQNCLNATIPLVEAYLAGDAATFKQRAEVVHGEENKADSLKWEIGQALADGAFLPTIRSDIYRLVESVDKLAGRGEDVAIFLTDQMPSIPADYQADLGEILALNVACADQLHAALDSYFQPKGELSDLHAHTNDVGKLESQIDTRQSQLTQQLFSSDLELAAKIHLVQLLNTICDISNAAEDVADELAFAAMRSVV